MLKVKNATKFYGSFKAVDNLSFEVKPGEIFGLLGVNGAGKTTTFRMIMGLLDFDAGEITLDGNKIDYSITDKIGFLTEERSLLTKMTVREQCLFYGALKGMSDKEIMERLNYLLKKFEISDYIDRKIKDLSKGNQQKIQFITAIINKPRLLILDEPFSGLDPFNVEFFEKEIIELANEGSMIIFSSHRMEHVEQFCKKLVILLKGKAVLSGELMQIKKQYHKKNIIVNGEFDLNKVKKIKGVLEIIENANEYIIKIENANISNEVFEVIKKGKNIIKYTLEEPSLNEIFIAKVGESYEK
ncbi:MAG: ATP-binding cassette domain-containing protein [Bacilli bacterium]|nr:ATP-binding cassette domain-containing protein [Bacilli bacterium]MDD4734167.1 ATP-binding cassette domain-containing protein [Bacilli bacterium]